MEIQYQTCKKCGHRYLDNGHTPCPKCSNYQDRVDGTEFSPEFIGTRPSNFLGEDMNSMTNVTIPAGGYQEEAEAREFIRTRPSDFSGENINSMTDTTIPADRSQEQTAPVNDKPFIDTRPIVDPFEDRTLPLVDPFPKPVPADENVVGWLVAITGRDMGKDYRIYGHNTSIGRTEGKIILKDEYVSKKDNCIIRYYEDVREYYLVEGQNAKNGTYVNKRPVVDKVELRAYDQIQIGKEKYLFIPLCNDKFSWGTK